MKWPSTTGIIKFFLAGDYAGFVNDEAMQRGRLVHAGCHLLASHDEDRPWEVRHPECHGYLDAYRRFLREHEFALAQAEQEFKCATLRFTSRPDEIGLLDGKHAVLELKSGGLPKWVRLQTAGQVLAIGKPQLRRFALQLKADGKYVLIPHEDFRDLDRFRAMVDTWWTIQEFQNGKTTA